MIRTLGFHSGQRQYVIEVDVSYYTERNHGADADGNRGEDRDFIDDIEILSIQNNYTEKYIDLGRIPGKVMQKLYDQVGNQL